VRASSFLHGAVGGLVGRGGCRPGLEGVQEGGGGRAAGAGLALGRAGAGVLKMASTKEIWKWVG